MRRLLLLIISPLLILSCSEKDDPKPDSDKLSTIVGNYIYTAIKGNKQTGYPGQTLSNEIQITVKDLNGAPVYRSLEFELSDESGEYYRQTYYNSDTIKITWKLGCNDQEQYIKVLDNVCGVAKSGCIDAEIFKITASATDEITSGWYSPCTSFDEGGYNLSLLVSDKRIALRAGENIYSIINPLEDDWKQLNSSFNYGYGYFSMLSNGEIFRSGSYPAVSNWSNESWINLSLPISSSDIYMEVSDNGYYFIGSEYRSEIYSSNNLSNWSQAIDIYDHVNYYNDRPQAIASQGNYFYILVAGNYVLKVEAASGNVTTYEFPENSWTSYGDLGEMKAVVKGEKVFVRYNYDNSVEVLDLTTLNVESYYVESDSRLFKSENDIYLMSRPNYIQVWSGASFSPKEYPVLESSNYYYDNFGIYKGSPVLVTSGGNFYYYID